MNPCDKCKRPMDLKCCHNCKKDAAECDVWHECGKDCPKWEAQIQTNADRIRAMSDEELAEDFCKTVLGVMNQLGVVNTGSVEDAVRKRLEWLKQPAEVDHE